MDHRSTEAQEYRKWYHWAAWKSPKHGRSPLQLRAEPLCRFCEAAGRVTEAKVADHIERHGGDWDKFWNGPLQSLCVHCHNTAKQQVENRGYHDMCDAAGYPLCEAHPANKRRT